jgi:hypothetical protein
MIHQIVFAEARIFYRYAVNSMKVHINRIAPIAI